MFCLVFLLLCVVLLGLNAHAVSKYGFFVSGSNQTEYLAPTQSFILEALDPEAPAGATHYGLSRGVLLTFVTTGFVWALGRSFPVYLLPNLFFLVVFILAVGGIGVCVRSYRAGAMAMILAGLVPTVFAHSMAYNLDMSVAAMSLAAFYLLLRTDHLERPLWSALFGLVFGLAILAKTTAPIYLLPPLLLHPFLKRPQDVRGWARRGGNLALAVGVAALVFFAVQGRFGMFEELLQSYRHHFTATAFSGMRDFDGTRAAYRIPFAFGPVLPLAALVALPLAFFGERRRSFFTLAVFFAVPTALFAFRLPFGFDRFFLAPIGALAVLVATVTQWPGKARLTAAAMVFLAVLAGANFAAADLQLERDWFGRRLNMAPTKTVFGGYPALVAALTQSVGRQERPTVVYSSTFTKADGFPARTMEFIVRQANPRAAFLGFGPSMPGQTLRNRSGEIGRMDFLLYFHHEGGMQPSSTEPTLEQGDPLLQKQVIVDEAIAASADRFELVREVDMTIGRPPQPPPTRQRRSGVLRIYRNTAHRP